MQKENLTFWILSILFFLLFLSVFVLHEITNVEALEYIVEEEEKMPIDTIEVKLDSVEVATCEQNRHTLKWSGYGGFFGGKEYRAIFQLCQEDFLKARQNRVNVPLTRTATNQLTIDYAHLVNHDQSLLKNTIKTFKKIAETKNLNFKETAEMVVSFIQHIDYVLVHHQSCQYYINQCAADEDAFTCKWHLGRAPFRPKNGNTRNPCLENIEPYGVQSPAEFIFNLNGDCDTRTTFAFLILKNMGYDVVILNSDVFAHSILGINLNAGPFATTYYYDSRTNKKFYVWETTATGNPIGVFAFGRRFQNSEWYIALN